MVAPSPDARSFPMQVLSQDSLKTVSVLPTQWLSGAGARAMVISTADLGDMAPTIFAPG